LAWFPLIVYMAGLLIISVAPIDRLTPKFDISDKSGHAAAYLLMSYLFLKALSSRWSYSWRTALGAASLAFSFGALIELVQYFLPYRYFESLDMVANLTGVTTAQLIIFLLRKTLFKLESINGGSESR